MILLAAVIVGTIVLGSIYALMAIGLNLIYAVAEVVQLAQGDMLVVGAYVGYLITRFVPNLFLAEIGAIVGCGLLGVVVQLLLFRPLAGRGHLPPLVAGLMLGTAIEEGLRATFFQGNPVRYPSGATLSTSLFNVAGVPISEAQVVIVAIVAVLAIGLNLLLNRTKLGLAMRAVAERPACARMLGVPVATVVTLGFGLGSALAGAAGVLIAVVFSYITPFIGIDLGFVALAICLFGGLGSLSGAVIGAFILAFTEQVTTIYIASSYKDAIAFTLIIVVMVFRPSGLMGRLVAERP
ncbi:MAG TPA: branched-chain amino acid ABC transporter permease [Candidatus Dormibacteraeota bacterium]|nr:branched-chain amino acid ABC transporter permease [Candidatus Dormibacteraeota bacterium]